MAVPTLRLLLARRELGLGLLTREDALPLGALDAEISWVHSSDLADPGPFLIPGQLLLTAGTQFSGASGAGDGGGYDAYAGRLVAHDVVGLGFGVEVVSGTPPPLLDACLRAGLPLIEVPYRTPFIAIARYAADLVAQQQYARNTWALSAQRAISLAALRPDGLAATLAELARQLDRWVVLVNAAGAVERVFPARALTASTRQVVEAEAGRMLAARRRAASTLAEGDAVVSLQTIGASDRLLGVLAHGGPGDVDQAAQHVVTGVVALAGLALYQGRALDSARSALRAALLRALDDGEALASELGALSGLSEAGAAALGRARAGVDAAIRRSEASTEPIVRGPLLAALDDEDAPRRAADLLAPLTARDPQGTLGTTLLAWLEHNGVYDAAARAVGVHRHTLTARIRAAERALGRDLESFADRAEVWAALRVTTGARG